MYASELRKIASEISNENINKQVDSATEYLESLSVTYAKKGDFGLAIPITKLPFNKDILLKTFSALSKKGYTCTVQNEITAYYSNIDCDSEDFFYMRW